MEAVEAEEGADEAKEEVVEAPKIVKKIKAPRIMQNIWLD